MSDSLLAEEIFQLVLRDCRRHGLTDAQENRQLAQADQAIEGMLSRGQSLGLLVAALRLETRISPYGILAGPSEWSRLAEDFAEAVEFSTLSSRGFERAHEI